MAANGDAEYNRKVGELTELIRAMKRELISKYGPKVRKYWR